MAWLKLELQLLCVSKTTQAGAYQWPGHQSAETITEVFSASMTAWLVWGVKNLTDEMVVYSCWILNKEILPLIFSFQVFHNCSCVEGQGLGLGNSSAVLGQCQRESCTKAFPYFLALQTACAFILALGGTPTYMIMFRWNTLPYLDHKAWEKRNRKLYLLFHFSCEEWHVDQIVPLRIYLPVLWNPALSEAEQNICPEI